NLLERQYSRADFQQAHQRLKQKTHTAQGKKHDFRKLKQLEIEIREPSQKHIDISLKHSALGTFFLVGN
uniref:hypothetical protein n=1 Tax=Vibrio parahaemolyticus TaxID=670 RepID=UPI00053B0AD6